LAEKNKLIFKFTLLPHNSPYEFNYTPLVTYGQQYKIAYNQRKNKKKAAYQQATK